MRKFKFSLSSCDSQDRFKDYKQVSYREICNLLELIANNKLEDWRTNINKITDNDDNSLTIVIVESCRTHWIEYRIRIEVQDGE